jgi:hypothetical protein
MSLCLRDFCERLDISANDNAEVCGRRLEVAAVGFHGLAGLFGNHLAALR